MSNYSKSYYDENESNTSWYKVLHLIPENSSVLDIGCSSGHFGQELMKRRSCKVDGIELDSGDFKEASKLLRTVYQLDIENDDLSVIKNKYDVIYFGDVIEHLFHPIDALVRVKRLLKKDGVIVFSIPNMAHILIRLLLLKGDFSYTETGILDKTHVHFFNLKEIYRVFEEAGYTISSLDYTQKDMPPGFIKKWCKEAGIIVTKNYLDAARQLDATAFQFIGVASQSKIKKHKLDMFGPADYFTEYHNNVVNSLEEEIGQLKEENQQLKDYYKEIKANPIKFTYRKLKRVITERR
jgi:2-polyprenyl-3-methyl-5-hydroxy-6-metoxy-1,4-benzoquinol methylase